MYNLDYSLSLSVSLSLTKTTFRYSQRKKKVNHAIVTICCVRRTSFIILTNAPLYNSPRNLVTNGDPCRQISDTITFVAHRALECLSLPISIIYRSPFSVNSSPFPFVSRAGLPLTLCRLPPVEFSTVRRAPETYITTNIPQNPTASIHNVALDVCIHVCESVKMKKENSFF